MNLGYLDDCTLGGEVEMVARDVAKIIEIGGKLGLHLNISKCELISHADFLVSDPVLQSFKKYLLKMFLYWARHSLQAQLWMPFGQIDVSTCLGQWKYSTTLVHKTL